VRLSGKPDRVAGDEPNYHEGCQPKQCTSLR
jgi:hypothetical protein